MSKESILGQSYGDLKKVWQNRPIRHNTCKEEVHSIKLVILEAEKNGIKLDKEECLKTVAPLKFLKCAAIIVIFVIA